MAMLVALAIWTHYQPIPSVDENIMLAFRSTTDPAVAIGPEWLSVHFRDFTTLGSNWFLLLLTFVAALVCKEKGMGHTARFLVVTVLSGMALSFALKMGFDRPRPELVPHSTRVYTSSFPSGHAMMSSLTYACLATVGACAVKERLLGVWFVTIAVLIVALVGLSRVFLGVHWPTDVLAGWSAGITWFCVCRMVLLRSPAR